MEEDRPLPELPRHAPLLHYVSFVLPASPATGAAVDKQTKTVSPFKLVTAAAARVAWPAQLPLFMWLSAVQEKPPNNCC